MGYGLPGNLGSISCRVDDVSFSHWPWSLLILIFSLVHPTLCPEVMWPRREADISSSPSYKVKNAWKHYHICFHGLAFT